MDKTLVSCEYLAASSKLVSSESQHPNTYQHTLCVINVSPHEQLRQYINWGYIEQSLHSISMQSNSLYLHTRKTLLHTADTMDTWSPSSPPLSSRDNCLSAGHCPGQVQRGDGNWFCLGLVSARYQHQLAAHSRKVGGMKCAGDLAVDFNRVFYDFLISYVRKMQRRM